MLQNTQVSMENSNEWEKVGPLSEVMAVKRRRGLPTKLKYFATGLNANTLYGIQLKIGRIDDFRYKFDTTLNGGQWRRNSNYPKTNVEQFIEHKSGWMTGREWMEMGIDFSHVCVATEEKAEDTILVESMCVYKPEILISTTEENCSYSFDVQTFVIVSNYRKHLENKKRKRALQLSENCQPPAAKQQKGNMPSAKKGATEQSRQKASHNNCNAQSQNKKADKPIENQEILETQVQWDDQVVLDEQLVILENGIGEHFYEEFPHGHQGYLMYQEIPIYQAPEELGMLPIEEYAIYKQIPVYQAPEYRQEEIHQIPIQDDKTSSNGILLWNLDDQEAEFNAIMNPQREENNGNLYNIPV